MLGNLFKAFFAWGNGFLRTERRSLSNSSYAILAIARSAYSGTKPSRKRRLSAKSRAKIAAAQRRRWAKFRKSTKK